MLVVVTSLNFQHTDGIKEMVIYVESAKDMTRIPVWDFNQAKFDFWEHGRVEIPKFEDFKVNSTISCDIWPVIYFQIVISAVRGETGMGYVAVDDFHFSHSADDEEFCAIRPEAASPTSSTAVPTSTTEFPGSLPRCNFDADTCDWELFGLGFKWYITNSANLSAAGLPGPLAAHEGNYLYAHGADGISGELTSILSPMVERSDQGYCVSFFYSLFVRHSPRLTQTDLRY